MHVEYKPHNAIYFTARGAFGPYTQFIRYKEEYTQFLQYNQLLIIYLLIKFFCSSSKLPQLFPQQQPGWSCC